MSKPIAVPTATRYTRCSHRFAASGRQCRLLTSDRSGLCPQHLAKKKAAAQSADFAELLFDRADGMKTAQGINHSLTYLYELLARDLISVRRAQSLAYIGSLILRTLPAIDHENHHNIGSAAYQAALAKQAAAKSSAVSSPSTSANETASAVGAAIPDPPPHTKPS